MSDYLEGINSIMEALRAGRTVEKIYLDQARRDRRIENILHLATQKGIPIERVDKARLKKISETGLNQGIMARVSPYRYYLVEDIIESIRDRGEEPFIIILDGVEDPQNLGAIIRTAECAGVNGIIIPERNSARITAAVGRASAGAVEHMKVAMVTNLVNTITYLKENGLWVVGTEAQAQDPYFEVNLPTPVALVIGGEGRGIRRLVKEHCDILVSIPMCGQIESLNASIACALVTYEVLRQRRICRK